MRLAQIMNAQLWRLEIGFVVVRCRCMPEV